MFLEHHADFLGYLLCPRPLFEYIGGLPDVRLLPIWLVNVGSNFVPNSNRLMQRQTTFFLPFFTQVVRRYMEPHSPQTSLSESAYLLQYLPSALLVFFWETFFCCFFWSVQAGHLGNLHGDDSWVVVSDVIFGELSVVFLLFLSKKIYCIAFL